MSNNGNRPLRRFFLACVLNYLRELFARNVKRVITTGQGETIYKVKEILLLRPIPYTLFSHKKSHVGFASYPEHGSRLRLAECLADR
ncbi:hypothetical protein D9E88_20435 [Escherichia coli]|uniref:Uncharacterized protein n=1 Tax=Escherichia coli TaxID=562 RepID=A0A3K2YMM2_ECOLX|nr:hypothetical protein [Escherichia coli]EFA5427596.1 hypothetical protein [Escherichia coli O117]EAC1530768.1 hypothetical protein [Escherichia coli]EAC1995625.1 hypothetical protein [Escherichia coli]EEW1615381.1 hypothetical protein [Escherichia coli]